MKVFFDACDSVPMAFLNEACGGMHMAFFWDAPAYLPAAYLPTAF
jgi:hypothetical protein